MGLKGSIPLHKPKLLAIGDKASNQVVIDVVGSTTRRRAIISRHTTTTGIIIHIMMAGGGADLDLVEKIEPERLTEKVEPVVESVAELVDMESRPHPEN